ncbi:hypothetical protein [Aromatoleum anaerobium]|nr:hypothetical protein [Aromatoleum anaerobium]MCK0505331.1 hypothetical protein [Aromatoleum anaerobium]
MKYAKWLSGRVPESCEITGGWVPNARTRKAPTCLTRPSRVTGANPTQQMMGMCMCMGMCSEMLAAIHKTTSMAAFATPELHTLFSEWMESLEHEALAALDQQGEVDAAALATKLKISEASAIHLVAHLASKSKVSLSVRATGKGEP